MTVSDYGKGEHLLVFLSFQQTPANDQVIARRCQGSENSAARLRAAAVETSQPQPADDQSSAVGQHQSVTSVAGPHDDMSCDDVDPELAVD